MTKEQILDLYHSLDWHDRAWFINVITKENPKFTTYAMMGEAEKKVWCRGKTYEGKSL